MKAVQAPVPIAEQVLFDLGKEPSGEVQGKAGACKFRRKGILASVQGRAGAGAPDGSQ